MCEETDAMLIISSSLNFYRFKQMHFKQISVILQSGMLNSKTIGTKSNLGIFS